MNKDLIAINSIKFLGVDAINKANSGHPGIVIGAAPMAHTLFTRHLTANSKNSKWINRDRFVLSAGHGSMLLYGINHLAGYDLTMDDIKDFRQLGRTPGHPEYGHTDGVETTSGPLGQGISNAVGMALAETHLAKRFNKPGFNVMDHYTYVLVGDGDLQEGVALEAISFAGHNALGKLIVLFDSNDIQLDGEVKNAFSENHKTRFEGAGWHYLRVEDGNNLDEINKAITNAKEEKAKPTLIEIKTVIGEGTSTAGTSKVHGAPIGNEEALKLRKVLNWDYEPFVVPQEAYDLYNETFGKRGSDANIEWNLMMDKYKNEYPEEYQLWTQFTSGKIDVDITKVLKDFENVSSDSTRNSSGKTLDYLQAKNLNIIGGSADLTGSTKAKGADGDYSKDNRLARNINFGVREHAMGAIANGIVLHGGLRAFTGAFFVFSDYMKPSVRLAAIMQIPTIFVFSHDTVFVGEDGPTHQPIEQLAGLRVIPGLNLIRPADAIETAASWQIALESEKTPTALIYTRQNVDKVPNSSVAGVKKGGYVVSAEEGELSLTIVAAGSEVGLALDAKGVLGEDGLGIRIVSMPSTYLFDNQTNDYKQSVIPNKLKTVAVEMGASAPWYKYANDVYGLDQFGISSPYETVAKHFKFTKEDFAQYLKTLL